MTAFFTPLLAIVLLITTIAVVIPRPTQAQASGPIVIIKDYARKVSEFIDKQSQSIKDKIRVAGDVAYKTGLRIFYQQLAQMTFSFVSTAGSGQKPLFMTDPYYYQNFALAVQNDALDNIAKDFGVEYAGRDTGREKAIALLARGILNPATACEDNCHAVNVNLQKELTALTNDTKRYKELATQDPNGLNDINCPLVLTPGTTEIYTYSEGLQGNNMHVVFCAQALSATLSAYKQQTQNQLNLCVKACSAAKRTTLQNNQQLNTIVGRNNTTGASTADVSLFINETFRPKQSDLGTLLKINSDVQTKGIAKTAAERDILTNSDILPVRTLSGAVKAPGKLTGQYATLGLESATKDVSTYTGSQIANVIAQAAGDALIARLAKAMLNNCGLNPQACKAPTGTSAQARLIFGSGSIAAGPTQILQFGKPPLAIGDPSRNTIIKTSALQSSGILDQRFAQAIDQKLTVKEALDGGYLDGGRTFGYTLNGEEPSDGYPFRTILYLRQARIVPVGWELAAKFIKKYDHRDISLNELISKFTICGQDSQHDDNGNDADGLQASSYCGLIDPDWVLKSPLTYCRKQGAGEEIVAKNFICDEDTNGNGRIDCSDTVGKGGDLGHYEIQRNPDTCADEPTCVVENEDGSCRSYGYCFEERRTFRFDGTICPSYYASCTDYTGTDGDTVGYLTKNLETNGCSSDNAGCQAYCGDRNQSGTFVCTANGASVACEAGETCSCRLPNGESCTVAGGARTCTTASTATCTLGNKFSYFDRDVQACSSSDEGCRQFINMSGPTNLLANGGFEFHVPIDGSTCEDVKGWGCRDVSTDTSGIGVSNFTSVSLPSSGTDLVRTAPLDLGRPLARGTYTLSFYGKADAACDGRYGLQATDASVKLDGASNIAERIASYTTSWQRFSSTFFFPDGDYDNIQSKHTLSTFVKKSTCNLLIDNMQLEGGESSTVSREYASSNLTYLNKNRISCNSVDVGCETYKPTSGGDSVTGVVNWPDKCSIEDAGCKAYRKEATTNIPVRAKVDPINLTASSGKTCSASEVGCEEYTNLDVVAQGGEGKEYYSRIQQCVKPVAGNSTQATYYSWVGDNEAGFQLKSYRLKMSDSDTGPCTNLQVTASPNDNNPDCEDVALGRAECLSTDFGVNPDCSQYFDGSGHVFYRLRSRVIPVSEQCHPYRNSIDGAGLVYLVLGSQSASCRAEAAQCRAFTGNAGTNTTSVFKDTFEGSSTVTDSWASVSGAIDLSAESVTAGGRSMDATGTVTTQITVLDQKIRKGATYTLSFWAKPVNATELSQAFLKIGSQNYFLAGSGRPTVALASEWHPYTVGPATVEVDQGSNTVELRLQFTNGGADAQAYVDNIELTEVRDHAYLVDGSFRTCPNSALGCEAYTDRNNTTTAFKSVSRLCTADAAGCTAYLDTNNSDDPFTSSPIHGVDVPADTTASYVASSNSFCTASAKGCTAFGVPTTDVNQKISSFSTVYVKDDPDQHSRILCSKSELYCSEFTSNNGSKSYFKDPGSQTCEYKKLGGNTDYRWYVTGTSYRCPTVTPPAETVPTGLSCTRSCGGGLRDGLSCVVNEDCPASNGTCVNLFCQGGARNGLSCETTSNADPLKGCTGSAGSCVGSIANVGRACTAATAGTDCVGGNICATWVGVCPVEQSGCNEFRDPSDPAICRSTCSLELDTTTGRPIAYDDACQATYCLSGAKAGANCSTNLDCTGLCTGGTPASNGKICNNDSPCLGGGTCANTGVCSAEGIPGCRSYTYLRQSLDASAAECNGRVDVANGCRPFNDTSDPNLNFRSF